MKKLLLLLLSIIFISNSYSQSIYKGLKYGMTESEAKTEFKKNKNDYTTVDIGNGFLYRIYRQNFVFDENKLVGVLLAPKGSAMGMSYDSAKLYLSHTRGFFESLDYETFIENEWYDAPINYGKSGGKWGLVLNKKDNSTFVQLYPINYQLSGKTVYLVKLMIWHYDTWLKWYNAENKVQENKKDNSGF